MFLCVLFIRFFLFFIFLLVSVILSKFRLGRCTIMKEMGTEPRIKDNATIAKKLHNFIFSDNFCAICFENGCENSIEHEVEATSDDRPNITLGEIYTIIFREKKEDLASHMICKSCMEKLKHAYNFIQNSKSATKLLYKYVDMLKSKIIQLIVQIKNPEAGSVALVALDYEETNNNTNQVTDPTEKITEKSTRLVKNNNSSVERMKSHKSVSENVVNNRPSKQKEDNLKCDFGSKHLTVTSSQESSSSHSCTTCLKHNNSNSDKLCNLKCKECGSTCIHLKHIIHFQEQIQKNPRAKCLDCDFTCRKKETLITHINKHHFGYQPYACSSCSQKFHSKRSLDTHISSHNQLILIKCKYCGLHMDDKSVLEVHKDFCKERKKFYEASKERNENIKESQHSKVLNKKTENKICVESKIIQKTNMNTHSTDENPDRIKNNTTTHPSQLQWEKCSDTQLNLQSKSHTLKKEAKKQKPHLPCGICDYTAWNTVLLECHMNRYHLKIKPYICHICSKSFIGRHLLKKHVKLHTVDRSVTCNKCGKKLSNPSCLKSHLKLHTGEKNYPCDICGEKFRSSSIMNVHRVKKHTEKDVDCPLCSSKFFTLVEMRRHVVKMHWKKKTKFDPRKVEGLENYYHLFHDRRRIKIDGWMKQDVDFYLPC